MKILIISVLFQPENSIGAVRPTNFAKWLAEFGHEVDVITMNAESPKLSHKSLNIFYIPNREFVGKFLNNTYSKIAEKNKTHSVNKDVQQNQQKKNKSPLRGIRTQLLTLLQNYDWKNRCLKSVSEITHGKKYDLLFSTYGPIGSYWLGRALYKKGFAKYWVSDYRDLLVVESLPPWFKKFYGYYQVQSLKEATAITVVSFGAANTLRDQYCRNNTQKNKVFVIHNGYEMKPSNNDSIQKSDGVLKICYTGALYAGQRDMSLLFEAISELIEEERIEAKKIQIHYAGGESEELLWQAKSYDMDQIIVNHGFIARTDALLLQNTSDIMVVLSWNTEEEQGILPGKFYEYVAAEKPIISIISGDLPNAELSTLVNDMNLGIACEYISGQKDLALLKEYILKCYQFKEKGDAIPFNPCKEWVAEYRYDKLTRKLENLFYSLINE